MENISVGIMSSSKFEKRWSMCKKTWASGVENLYIFGGEGSNSISSELTSISGAGEDWQSCFLKQQLGLKFMWEKNQELDWYGIWGCDNVVFLDRLQKDLEKYSPEKDFLISQPCGLWQKSPQLVEVHIDNLPNTFRAACGGAGVILSRSLMKKCYDIIDEFNLFWQVCAQSPAWLFGCADVAIALMCHNYFGVGVEHLPGLFSQPPTFYLDPVNDRWFSSYKEHPKFLLDRALSFHYIKPENMEEIWQKYK
ncbi:hypothetical protein EBU71_03935 [bacterium]|nr:hypothetical protein [Candidatus Elulimicrobium humile]